MKVRENKEVKNGGIYVTTFWFGFIIKTMFSVLIYRPIGCMYVYVCTRVHLCIYNRLTGNKTSRLGKSSS